MAEVAKPPTPNRFFVTAIGTDSGKTVVSAILARALNATYWKPIQCGTPTDTDQIMHWLGKTWPIVPERYRLLEPCSPHQAAYLERKEIDRSDFSLPRINGGLIVEGAGGLLVPINASETVADVAKQLQLPVILVVNHYLGSINHSLLTLQALQQKEIPLAGVVFNGVDFQQSESLILNRAGCPCILRIRRESAITSSVIDQYSRSVKW